MKSLLFFGFCLFSCLSLNAQTTCGTVAPNNYQKFDESRPLNNRPLNTIYCINVSFHIVKRSDGSGGFPSSNIDAVVQNLNEGFNEYGIFLNKMGTSMKPNSEKPRKHFNSIIMS